MKRRNQHSLPYFLLALLLSLSLAAGCSPAAGNTAATTEANVETESVTSETAVSETDESDTAASETAAAETVSETETVQTDTAETAEASAEAAPDYSDAANWAYLETEDTEKAADVFFICPSVYGGSDDACNMSLSDMDTKESFVGAINMEKASTMRTAAFFRPTTARSA